MAEALQPVPFRDDLTEQEIAAARQVSPVLWSQPYTRGKGPMHFAVGPFWPAELRSKARRWRALADAAEVCAAAIDRTNR